MTGRLFGQHHNIQSGKNRLIISKCLPDQPFYPVSFHGPFRNFFRGNHAQTGFVTFIVTGGGAGKNQEKSIPGTGWIGHDGTISLSIR